MDRFVSETYTSAILLKRKEADVLKRIFPTMQRIHTSITKICESYILDITH